MKEKQSPKQSEAYSTANFGGHSSMQRMSENQRYDEVTLYNNSDFY